MNGVHVGYRMGSVFNYTLRMDAHDVLRKAAGQPHIGAARMLGHSCI